MAFAEFTEVRSLAGVVASLFQRGNKVSKSKEQPQETFEEILARRAAHKVAVTVAEGGQRDDMSMLRSALYAKDA